MPRPHGRNTHQAQPLCLVDIEADGPIPGPYSMLSLGAAVAGTQDADGFTAADPTRRTFYRELHPISEEFVPEALAVSGLDRRRLGAEGSDPAAALTQFTRWVREVSGTAQPVMCGYPASYDWTFLYWYLIRYTGASPFGHSGCLDMKTLYATKAGLPLRAVGKRTMPRELLSERRHTLPQALDCARAGGTPIALDDATEQAELFASLMAWPGPSDPPR
ncbi:exonuclease [Streptomyces sp. NPDC057877]|uniref:exonuclease n=1 Tax=Streptomyces sp. NPDC057877 TaxID=3346269 RepID=UPI0036BD6AF8